MHNVHLSALSLGERSEIYGYRLLRATERFCSSTIDDDLSWCGSLCSNETLVPYRLYKWNAIAKDPICQLNLIHYIAVSIDNDSNKLEYQSYTNWRKQKIIKKKNELYDVQFCPKIAMWLLLGIKNDHVNTLFPSLRSLWPINPHFYQCSKFDIISLIGF